MSWRTNHETKKRFRPIVYPPLDQPECICKGECIGNTCTPCPFRGYKTLGGYCRRCYPDVKAKKEQDEQFFGRCICGKRECLEHMDLGIE